MKMYAELGYTDKVLAMFHPPAGRVATKEYIENPSNWGPPMPPYSVMQSRLTLPELILLYLKIDSNSPSWVAWRRELIGTRGRASKIREGSPALVEIQRGGTKSLDYYKGRAFYATFLAHRVVFYLHNGFWPEVVDHVNRNSLDNHPDNLRSSTHVRNAQNRARQVAGFHWHTRSAKFRVLVGKKHIGNFDDMLSARAAYIRAYTSLYGHLPHANVL